MGSGSSKKYLNLAIGLVVGFALCGAINFLLKPKGTTMMMSPKTDLNAADWGVINKDSAFCTRINEDILEREPYTGDDRTKKNQQGWIDGAKERCATSYITNLCSILTPDSSKDAAVKRFQAVDKKGWSFLCELCVMQYCTKVG